MMRLALSLAVAGGLASAQPAAAGSGWSDVLKLAPGTEIVIAAAGSPPVHRYLVAGSDAGLTVLHAAHPAIPADAGSALRDLAARHPEYFAAGQRRRFVIGRMRIGPDGVFVADQKVAEFGEVFAQLARDEVTEIAVAKGQRNAAGCAIVGYMVGAPGGGFAGGLAGGAIGAAVSRKDSEAMAGMGAGVLIGAPIGATLVYRTCRHTPEIVIYRAP